MLEMLERLQAIELEKRRFPMGSDGFVAQAAEAERLSRVIFRWSGLQQQMADESVGAVERGDMQGVPITAVEPRPLDRILAAWREAQIRLEIARPGSPEAETATADIERLRDEYQAASEAQGTGPSKGGIGEAGRP